MNLQKLFELQRQLDEHIEQQHPQQEGEDRLAKKILALQVEIGELANEARFFKYWSNDQEPRIVVREWKLYEDTIKEYGDSTHRRYEGVVRPVLRQPLLEEFADCLHFLLSIGLEICFTEEPTEIIREHDVIHQFNKMFYMIGEFYDFYIRYGKGCGLYDMFDDLFGYFLGLGEMLGFSWEEVEQAYMKKNAVNHQRQETGY